jgi:hypothetical protein
MKGMIRDFRRAHRIYGHNFLLREGGIVLKSRRRACVPRSPRQANIPERISGNLSPSASNAETIVPIRIDAGVARKMRLHGAAAEWRPPTRASDLEARNPKPVGAFLQQQAKFDGRIER